MENFAGVYPSLEEIKAMTRKQLVQLSPGIIRHIMQVPDQLDAFTAIVNSPEGAAALSDVVQEISQPEVIEEVVEVTPKVSSEVTELTTVLEKTEKELQEIKASENKRLAIIAEDEELLKANITPTRDENGKITKYVKRYQSVDENGVAIGLPTHLEAQTLAQLSVKLQAAHENALRLAERVKKQKISFVRKEENPTQPLSQEEVNTHLRTLQRETPDSPKYKEVMALLDSNKAIENQLRAAALDEKEASLTWMETHKHDFKPNAANSNLINTWLKDNSLAYTVDNLEIAFLALQSQLVPVEVNTVEAPAIIPVNTTSAPAEIVTPSTPVEVAPTPVTPAVAAPATPAQPNKVVPARRPGLFGGITPGTLTASRPVLTQTPTLTKKDIARMKPEEIRRRIKTEPGFEAMFVKVANSKA